MSEDDIVGVGDYKGAAAGWGALKAVADAVRGQMAVVKETRGLLSMNQPHGFDCPAALGPIRNIPRLSSSARTVSRPSPGRRQLNAQHRNSSRPMRSASSGTGRTSTWKMKVVSRIRWSMIRRLIDTRRYRGTRRSQGSGSAFAGYRSRTWQSFTRQAGPRMRRLSSISCLRENTEPITFPIARTCVTRRPASACRRQLVSAREP